MIAIFIDWTAALAVSFAFFATSSLATLLIFAGTTFLFQATLGTTLGHWLVGVGTRTADGGIPGFARAGIRTIALCLLLPAVITDPDRRGLHERWSGTYIVPLRERLQNRSAQA